MGPLSEMTVANADGTNLPLGARWAKGGYNVYVCVCVCVCVLCVCVRR